MEISQLQHFVDAVRQGSFAAVARARDVEPSSISRAVAALENELGIRLLQRTTRTLSLTEAGAVYFDRVEPLVDELERAQLAAADVGTTARGLLRVSSPVSFAQLNIVPLIPEFRRRYPDVRLDLLLTDVALDLIVERIDCAVRLGPLADSGLIAHRLSPMLGVACASPAYLARRAAPVSPQELAEHDCLPLDRMQGFDGRWRFQDAGGAVVTVAVDGPVRSSNAVALKECALAGLGITLQARWIVGRELRAGTLVPVLTDYRASATAIDDPGAWLVHPSRTYVPVKVRAFIAFMREHFAAAAPWDQPAGAVLQA